MPYPPTNRFRVLLRKWGMPAAAVTGLLLVATSPFLLNWGLKSWLEDYASRVNGAQVTIRDLDVSLVHGTCVMEGVEVTRHTQLMKNLLEIDEVKFTFERGPLFGLKLVVPEMRVVGIHFNTTRERSGVLDSDESLPPTALLDRIAPGIYDSVKASLGETPLRNLGALTMGIAMRNSVDPYHQELETYQRLKSYEQEFDRLLLSWEQENDRAQGVNREDRAARLTALRTRVQNDAAHLSNKVEHTFDTASRDIDKILRKLGIPSLQSEDFTREVLGRRTLSHLERVAYWIDLSRRKMGVASRGTALATVQAGAIEPNPRVWIRKIVLHSRAGSEKNKGDVTGEITNVASSPLGTDRPLRIELRADFPGLRIAQLKLNATINHSQPDPREDIDFSVGSAPVSDWALEQSPDLKLSIAGGTLGLVYRSRFEANEITGNWSVTLRNADLKIASRYALMENTLKEVLMPHAGEIAVMGSVGGVIGKVNLTMESKPGRDLALALKEKFRAPVKTASETIQDELHDRFSPPVRKLRERIQSSSARFDRRLVEAIETLSNS